LVLALLLVPVIGTIIYDSLWVRPRLAQLKAMLPPDVPSVPSAVGALVRASSPHGLEVPVWRMLADQTSPPFAPSSNTQWHLSFFVGSHLLRWHLSDEELSAIYTARVWVGNDQYGLESASVTLFGLPLAGLSTAQAAEVAAVPSQPSIMLSNPERRQRHANLLLRRAAGDL
jgi:hypothetical protein